MVLHSQAHLGGKCSFASGLCCVKLCRNQLASKPRESENTGVPDLAGLVLLILLPLSASDRNVLLCVLFITDAFQGVL